MKHPLSVFLIGLCLAFASCDSIAPPAAGTTPPAATHQYRLDIQGTPGTRTRMLLVTKPSEGANPDRREEIVRVPAQIDFRAVRCYAWFDSLPEGESGKEGDAFTAHLLKDANPQRRMG
ncbi:MAG TPA: hypothetical protein VGR35_07310 [Tepidisphaeraceae bacterium]|nr:hypothetical protein [Tepidisphaeraceae bacterium]